MAAKKKSSKKAKKSTARRRAAKKTAKKRGSGRSGSPMPAFMKADAPERARSPQSWARAAAPDRSDQEAVGVHQAEGPAGQKNRRNIHADETLRPIFKARVSQRCSR